MSMAPLKHNHRCTQILLPALLFVVMLGGTSTAVGMNGGVAWQADLEQAAALAEKTNRLLFVHFYGDNCPPCKLMDSTVFTDIRVIQALNKDFIAVKVHTSKQKVVSDRFGVTAIPTDIVLKPNGQLLHRRQGGISNDRFAEYLDFLADKAKTEMPAAAPPRQPMVAAAAPVAAPAAPPAVPAAMPGLPPAVAAPIQKPQETAIRDPFTKQVVTTVTPQQEPTAAMQAPMQAPISATSAPPVVHQPMSPPVVTAAPVDPFQAAVAPQAMAPPTPAVPAPTMAAPATPVPAAIVPTAAAPAAPMAAPAVTESHVSKPAAPQIPSLALPSSTPPSIAPPAVPLAAATPQPAPFKEPPPGPPSNMDEVPKTMVEVPLGLEGYCPVVLGKEERWVPGNPAYYTMFRGHVFRFSSEEAMTEFAKSPLNYSPVAMGEDIVQMVNRNKKIYGNRKFGVWYQGRVFLFSSQESLDAFAARPEYYAEIAVKYETAFKGVHGLF